MAGKISKMLSNNRFIFGTVGLVIFMDQISKILVRFLLKPVNTVSVMGDFFRLTYVENPGIAFGVRVNNQVVFTILSILAVTIIFYYLFKLKNHHILRFAFAVILGGAFGNLIDRFLFGRVVDFFDFDFFNLTLPSFKLFFFEFHGYAMDRWPVFNIADIAVSTGMVLILVQTLFVPHQEDAHPNAAAQED